MASHFPSRDEIRSALAIRALAGLGETRIKRAVDEFGSVNAVLESRTARERDDAFASADRTLHQADAAGIEVLIPVHERFPARVLELADPPGVLFAKGEMPSADPPAVAIVGTRAASAYGLRVARAIAETCVRAGATVVSGLAQGIDGAAHEAALAANGRTVAVLGTGINVVFPKRHRTLQAQIAERGLLLSERAPDSTGHGGTFPRRNRIIAALADVTVVVEAGETSGALITARHAVDLHRPVLCVPNAIDLPGARGSNRLLKEFAEPLLSPMDVLDTLSLRAQPTTRPVLDGDAATCWDAIQAGATTVDSICEHAALSTRAAASALSALELEGLVQIDTLGIVRSTLAYESAAIGNATPSLSAVTS